MLAYVLCRMESLTVDSTVDNLTVDSTVDSLMVTVAKKGLSVILGNHCQSVSKHSCGPDLSIVTTK